MDQDKVKAFREQVWGWYQDHALDLPWRRTANPYHIFVSEIMLQQTQIPRVLLKYPQFLKAFPTTQVLAKAPLRRVLKAWQGMGYNRRALYLKRAAQEIIRKHSGGIPNDIALLDELPGIGPYSARAIRCFAYDICEPFIETNIRRVIIYKFFPRKEKVGDREILHVLAAIQPRSHIHEWYWALMDYGREGLRDRPNPNRRSKHYAKQSKFEGSPRYIRAKIISYLLEKKKATVDELHASLTEDKHLMKLVESDVRRVLTDLRKEHLVTLSEVTFRIV